MDWTAEREAKAAEMWNAGASGDDISKALGGVTRSAVIGKMHRMGLGGDKSRALFAQHKQRQQREAERRRRIAARSQERPAVRKTAIRELLERDAVSSKPQYEELQIPVAERRSILTVESHECRWPIGDPQEPDFHLCGKRKMDGVPYCEFHARRAYQPLQERNLDRKAFRPSYLPTGRPLPKPAVTEVDVAAELQDAVA